MNESVVLVDPGWGSHDDGCQRARPTRCSNLWTSGIVKRPIEGPVWLGRTNLAGDGQADLVNHGGADKAVLAYAAAHYPDWRTELATLELSFGAFGENLTVEGGRNGGVHRRRLCRG